MNTKNEYKNDTICRSKSVTNTTTMTAFVTQLPMRIPLTKEPLLTTLQLTQHVHEEQLGYISMPIMFLLFSNSRADHCRLFCDDRSFLRRRLARPDFADQISQFHRHDCTVIIYSTRSVAESKTAVFYSKCSMTLVLTTTESVFHLRSKHAKHEKMRTVT